MCRHTYFLRQLFTHLKTNDLLSEKKQDYKDSNSTMLPYFLILWTLDLWEEKPYQCNSKTTQFQDPQDLPSLKIYGYVPMLKKLHEYYKKQCNT